MLNWARDQRLFLRQFRERFETTGAVLPSSRFLARALTGPLTSCPGPRRILEVGPGTGAVTDRIVRQLRPDDWFDLVEINPAFAQRLTERFTSDAAWRSVAPRSRVQQIALQEFRADQPYDVVISGLPFNNFPVELVRELLDRCLQCLKPDGTLSFFEYMYVRPLRLRVTRGQERDRLAAIEELLQARFRELRNRRDWVFWNFPPAWVQHLRGPRARA
jgi:phospholipid N-methyltransferase